MRTTLHNTKARGRALTCTCGFTMIELLVSSFIAAIVLSAVLTVFLMIGKIQTNAGFYADMERDANRSLERFSQDARSASRVVTVVPSPTTGPIIDVTLTIPHATGTGTDLVQYSYNPADKTFVRLGPDPVTGVPNTTTVLATNVESCVFRRWKLASLGPASTDNETDLLQIQVLMKKQRTTAVGTSDLVVSASYLLRNHKNT